MDIEKMENLLYQILAVILIERMVKMAKTREIACENYLYEGKCKKNREGTFRKYCQKCNLYKAKRGGIPARKDLRRKKIEDARRRDERFF